MSKTLKAFTEMGITFRKNLSLLQKTVQPTGTGLIISSLKDTPIYYFCMLRFVPRQMTLMAFSISRQFRQRAGSAKVSATLTLADVKKERNYELWNEGARWIDMKRWNEFDKAKTAGTHIPSLKDHFFDAAAGTKTATHVGYVTYSEPNAGKTIGFKAGKNEWFPYPFSETSINPNIVQNPGWN